MDTLLPWALATPPFLLLLAGLIPSRWANSHVAFMRKITLALTTGTLGVAIAAACSLTTRPALDVTLFSIPKVNALNIGVYFDSLAAIMLILISFIGLIIARYSNRYLDRAPRQGRFFRWMLFTLGAVLLLVISRNLLQFTASWMLTSSGLHQLLTHHNQRPWAIWAARKKFLISRLGDLFLVAALAATYATFNSFDYSVVFTKAVALQQQSTSNSLLVSAIGTLFALGAMTKSAQFPFHSWLPDTMEAPTPVSALMHAGIINAGGFLVIRLSPLVVLSHAALDILAFFGALTALLGGVVMVTQTSVKRSLAFSTIAQMGFMMLQCGLGGFSAALLHIVSHSLYKAHAFLSSGSVLDQAMRTNVDLHRHLPPQSSVARSLAGTGIAATILGIALFAFGIDLQTKPGGLVLGFILFLALSDLLTRSLMTTSWQMATRGSMTAALICCGYLGLFLGFDHLLANSVSHQPITPSPLDTSVSLIAAGGFLTIFILQQSIQSFSHCAWVQSLYVHASDGFYFDIPARRLTGWIYDKRAAVS